MENTSIYPKRLEHREIRLLKILPGKWLDEILCKLSYLDLEEVDEKGSFRLGYGAISYVWGTSPATHPIKVNGNIVFIRPNLDHALRQYRRRMMTEDYWTWNGLPKLVWVDSICINQQDKEEQARQVAIMDKIYSLASQVVVLLGGESNFSSPSYSQELTALSKKIFKEFGLASGRCELFDEGNIVPPPSVAQVLAQQQAYISALNAERVMTVKRGSLCQVISASIEDASEISVMWEKQIQDYWEVQGYDTVYDQFQIANNAVVSTESLDTKPAALFSFLEALATQPEGQHLAAIWEAWENHPAMRNVDHKDYILSGSIQLAVQSDWWQRAWTLQEGIVGARPVFILGGTSAPWRLFEEGLMTLQLGGNVDRKCECCVAWISSKPQAVIEMVLKFVAIVEDLSRSMKTCEILRKGTGAPFDFHFFDVEVTRLIGSLDRERVGQAFVADYLLRVLEKHRKRHATDPRDKVYAILPLVGEKHLQSLVTPDYTKDVCEVFAEVAGAIISVSGYLDILAFAANTPRRPGLPSWVPDWGSRENLDSTIRITSLAHYQTSGGTKANAIVSGKILAIKGVQIGRVKSTGKPMAAHKGLWRTLRNWLRLIIRHSACRKKYGQTSSDRTIWDKFQRTVFTDMICLEDIGLTGRAKFQIRDVANEPWCHSEVLNSLSSQQVKERLESGLENALHLTDQFMMEGDRTLTPIVAKAESILSITTNRRTIFVSDMGHIGLAPMDTRQGDHIFAIKGSRTPHILRATDKRQASKDYSIETSQYSLIGDCYLDGGMDANIYHIFQDAPEDPDDIWHEMIEII